MREDGTPSSGLARALRDRFREGAEPEEGADPGDGAALRDGAALQEGARDHEGERSPQPSPQPSNFQSDLHSPQGDPQLPTVSLPPGTRDRFTTRVARYLTESEERRALLLPGIREDLALLEEAGALGVVAEAARSVLRVCPGHDPLARLLSGRS